MAKVSKLYSQCSWKLAQMCWRWRVAWLCILFYFWHKQNGKPRDTTISDK